MKRYHYPTLVIMLLCYSSIMAQAQTARIIGFETDPAKQEIGLHWQDENGRNYGNFKRLKAVLNGKGQKLRFVMNGGMFHPSGAPVGLYIAQGKELNPIDTLREGYGNFYMQPNGIFYITKDKKAAVTSTQSYTKSAQIAYATQSGPMLLIDGKIHPKFQTNSTSKNIRNGVGILPDGRVLFAISKDPVNFHSFASYFLSKGCKNALYLDGAISKAYLPEENLLAMSGAFGVMIAVTESK